MSKEKSNIDNLFKNALDGMEGPVSDADWKAIQGMLGRQPKRRIAFWWWMAIPLFLMVAGFGFWELNLKNTNQIQPSANGISAPNNLEKPNGKTNPNKNESIIKSNSNSSKIGNIKEDETSNGVNHTSKNNGKPRSSDAASRRNKVKGKEDTQVETQNIVHGDNNRSEDQDDSNPATVLDSEEMKDDVVEEDKQKKVIVEVANPLGTDTLKGIKLPKAHWKVSLNVSPLNSFRNLITTGTNPAYYLARQSDESKTTLNAGLHIERIKNNFGFSAGVEKSSFGYEGRYSVTRNIYDSIPVLNTQGQVIGYFRLNYRDSNFVSKFSNQITYASIPLWTNSYVRINNNLSLKVGLGIQLGRMIKAEGVDIEHATLAFEDLKSKLNKNSLSAGIRMGMQYQLNPQWTVSAEGLYQRNLLSVYSQNNPVKMFPYVAGGNICIGYLLQTKK